MLVAIALTHVLATVPMRAEESSRSSQAFGNAVRVTVDIQTPGSSGSGVIVQRLEGGSPTYTILTAWHVLRAISAQETGSVIFPDQSSESFSRAAIIRIDDSDMALITLPSRRDYFTAPLGNSNDLSLGDTILVAGFSANRSPEITSSSLRASTGQLLSLSSQPDGYTLTYSAQTITGMSGGGIFDQAGRLVGIHGRGETLGTTGTKIAAMGLPINLFRNFSDRRAIQVPGQNRENPRVTACLGVIC